MTVFFFSAPFSCSLALFLAFVVTLLVLSLVTGNIQVHSPERQFLPIYLLKKNQAPQRYTTTLLIQNSSGDSQIIIFQNQEFSWTPEN